MVSEMIKYNSCVNVEADLHNGGSAFIRYFFYEAAVSGSDISIYKCYVKSNASLDVVERIEESSGRLVQGQYESVYKVDLISSYNSRYFTSSYVIYDDGNMIVLDVSDNQARLFMCQDNNVEW